MCSQIFQLIVRILNYRHVSIMIRQNLATSVKGTVKRFEKVSDLRQYDDRLIRDCITMCKHAYILNVTAMRPKSSI
jgi:hypothetical protein